MKAKGFLTEKIADVNNLYVAFAKASRGKQNKKSVLLFRNDFDNNVSKLRSEILSGEVSVGNYSQFTIFEPKERLISAAQFSERVLHHAIINICHDIFDKTLIETTYATRKGKGVYAAVDKAVEAATKYQYTAKLDIRKYFDSINHSILKALLRRLFKDPTLLAILDRIIDSYCVADNKGVPIGNLTSQYFANYYLSGLDHYIKEVLRIPVYVRYMDDMLLACDDKEYLMDAVKKINSFVNTRLDLVLKPPVIHSSNLGLVFLGYSILPYRYSLSGRSKRRFRSKLCLYAKLLKTGAWDEYDYMSHAQPLLAFVTHATSHDFRLSCIKQIG